MFGKVHVHMVSVLNQIKYIIDSRDVILYSHIHKHVVKIWDNLNVPLHGIAYFITYKYHSPSWWHNKDLGLGEWRKPHIDLEVQNGHMLEFDKSDPNEEFVEVRNVLSKYISEHDVFSNFCETKNQDRLNLVE